MKRFTRGFRKFLLLGTGIVIVADTIAFLTGSLPESSYAPFGAWIVIGFLALIFEIKERKENQKDTKHTQE